MDNQPKDESTKDEFDPGTLNLPPADSAGEQTSPRTFKAKRDWGKISRRALLAILAVVLIGAVAYGGYTLYKNNKDKPTPAGTRSQEQQSNSENSTQNNAEAPLTETYTSSGLRLEFMHPADWTVNEVDRGIRIESPAFSYSTLDKGEIEGKFKVYIRKGAREIDGQYIGRGYASAPSEKIDYTAPASDQRENTFLTAFGLDTPDNFAFFIVQGNFELKKGDTLGPKFANGVDDFLIVGGYGAEDKKDDLGTHTLDPANYQNISQYKTAVAIVKSLKLN